MNNEQALQRIEPMPVESMDRHAGPLDMEPAAFRAGLDRRKENRKALMEWIRSALVENTDYGRIPTKRGPSKPSLFKPGAEKICGMLGIISTFPTLAEYEQAALKGIEIKNIVLRCALLDSRGVIVAEGVGARSLAQDYGDLNKALKMSEKSAHIDATLRMAGLSEVFTQDIEDMPKNRDIEPEIPQQEIERLANELMQMRTSGTTWTANLSSLPRSLHGKVQSVATSSAPQRQLSEFFQALVKEGRTAEEAMRDLRRAFGRDASRRLQQTGGSNVDVRETSQHASQVVSSNTTANFPHGTGSIATSPATQAPAAGVSPSAPAQVATEEQRQRWIAELKRRGEYAVGYCQDKEWLLPPAGPPGDQTPGEPIELLEARHVPTTKREAVAILAELDSLLPEDFVITNAPPAAAPQPAQSEPELIEEIVGDEQELEQEIGIEIVTGKLEMVSEKTGRSKQGAWVRYGLKVGNDWYGTFDKVLGELAKKDKGHAVTIQFRRGDKGNDLVSIQRPPRT